MRTRLYTILLPENVDPGPEGFLDAIFRGTPGEPELQPDLVEHSYPSGKVTIQRSWTGQHGTYTGFNVKVCEALGLDPANVVSLKFESNGDDTTVWVEHASDINQATLDTWTEQYRICPADDEIEVT